MSFADRLTRMPLAFDPELGRGAAEAVPGRSGPVSDLLAGSAGSSPYLSRLIAGEAAWLGEILPGAPEPAMAALTRAAAQTTGPETAATLRALKRRAALLIALADLGGIWDLETVTGALTDFAEAATQAALGAALGVAARRGRIPGMDEDIDPQAAGIVVLAMGKMGAGELNYSSDIDLICLFDETRFAPDDEVTARAGFIRVTRDMAATLSAVTDQGYVFRTDLRLRPDAGTTPVCMSMAAAERYYEAEGRNWERAVYIKARPVAGDLAAGRRFLQRLRPFIWRRHLDFAAIHDTAMMRDRIRAHRGLYDSTLEGHNLKLGQGGIREIEFFAQTRQLIAGGRDPALRQRATVDALRALAAAGWMAPDEAETLQGDYRALREVEHRLQMIGDAQTHSLPRNGDGFDRLARLSGHSDTLAYRGWISGHLQSVHELTKPFFTPKTRAEPEPDLSDAARDIVSRWPSYPALRSERGQAIFDRLRPELLSRLIGSARPDEALANFDGFLRGLPAGVQLFSLFEANPTLIDLIVDISATTPGLSRYLSRHSSVLDAVLAGEFFAPWRGAAELGAELTAALAGLDYEAALDAARRWQKEWHFRVGVHLLRGLIAAPEAAAQYSDLAEAVVATLWPLAQAEVARRHGPAPGKGGAVVAMGSLGSRDMAAASDLDLLVIYEAARIEASDGPRPLHPRAWYAKATKALVAAISAPTAQGVIYAVDMRLRPSGRQGPVATGLGAFRDYQRHEAWTWEHLALTRARAIAGPAELGRQIEAVRLNVLAERRDRAAVLVDTAAMRQRLSQAGRQGDGIAVKPGPGGMQDIALLAQAGALLAGSHARDATGQIAAAQATGLIDAAAADALSRAAALFGAISQGSQLLGDRPLAPEAMGAGGRDFLARLAGASDWEALLSQSASARAEAQAIIAHALPDLEEP
ncbi:MAG: glutamine-synthetase adenylyltransferase [Pseudomonadota bacterium]